MIDLTDRQVNLLIRAGAIPGGDAAQLARTKARVHKEHRDFMEAVFDALDELGVDYETIEPKLARSVPELVA